MVAPSVHLHWMCRHSPVRKYRQPESYYVLDVTILNEFQVASVIAPIIGSLGAQYMLDPDTNAAGLAAGYSSSFAFYFAGRGGVLGDVDADVVYAAFMFFDRALIEKLWIRGIAVEGARAAGKPYMQCCDDWGRKHLSNVSELKKFIAPAEKLVKSIDVAGLSLFAAVRAEPLPTDQPALAYRLIDLLRELRGCYHIAALVSHGLSGLQATLAGENDESIAKLHGWAPPYPDCSGFVEQRQAAEVTTNNAMGRAIAAALTTDEMNQLATQTIRIQKELS